MKLLSKYTIILMLAIGLLASCSESRKRATEKLNELSNKADQLNATMDEGIDKIMVLDSVINSEAKQIKEFDSIVDKASSKIDSVANGKIDSWKNITN